MIGKFSILYEKANAAAIRIVTKNAMMMYIKRMYAYSIK